MCSRPSNRHQRQNLLKSNKEGKGSTTRDYALNLYHGTYILALDLNQVALNYIYPRVEPVHDVCGIMYDMIKTMGLTTITTLALFTKCTCIPGNALLLQEGTLGLLSCVSVRLHLMH